MSEKQVIRVLEIRQARNGWVFTGFESEGDSGGGYVPPVAFSCVAESVPRAKELLGELLAKEKWAEGMMIPPARGRKSIRP